ncbi:hypothetical protein G9A89_022710 [Geosiphon pyriformis]|nr:hypothetical protein G9A89_022710 [Geosiphon pyriformis]
MKKTIKVSGSEDGFKAVTSRKKRKGDVLEKSINNKKIAAKAPGSETGDIMESKSIDMEEKCLVEETSVNYGESGTFTEGDADQTLKGLHIKTKKVLGKPLGVIDYDIVNTKNNVLDDSFLLLPSLLIKPSILVSVCKSFALDIDFKKLSFIKKNFSGVNGFGGASTPSKFGGIINVTFTSEKAMMAAVNLANERGVVVNTDFKHSGYNYTNQAIVLKKISVRTFIETVCTAVFEFGIIKLIKMQLVDLWQKTFVKLENQNQADLLAFMWSILIGKDAVRVARANIDKQTWDSRDRFRTLLYTLSVGMNAHDLLAKIYEKKSAPISCPLAFGEKTWASVAGSTPLGGSLGYDSQFGEDIVMEVGLGKATSGKTAAVSGSNASPEVVKLENMLEGLSALVMSLLAHLDGLALVGGAPSLPLS